MLRNAISAVARPILSHSVCLFPSIYILPYPDIIGRDTLQQFLVISPVSLTKYVLPFILHLDHLSALILVYYQVWWNLYRWFP